jgi:hypothetical protein
MSSCETHWLSRMNDDGDTLDLELAMEQDRARLLAEHLARTKRQLAGDDAHLRKLRTNHQRTIALLARGQIAFEQSRLLLDRIDGLLYSPPPNENRLAD